MTPTLLIRHGELGVKGENRTDFERRLAKNVQIALARVGTFLTTREFGRLYARPVTEASIEAALAELSTVFGIASISPARAVDREMEAIGRAAEEALGEALGACGPGEAPHPGHTFKVETRRVDKSFPMTSMEVSRALGARLLDRVPGLKVDVHAPRITVGVEIRAAQAWVFARVVPGVGGMPVGTAGRVSLLLSGGIDSPVAGWMAMKRGARLDAVFVHAPPYTSDRVTQKVLSIARVLSRWHLAPIRVHVVPFTPVQEEIVKKTDERLRVVLYRRFMGRIAEAIGAEVGSLALVTGESLGQVASQTLENLAAIEDAVGVPVLRPLIGFDKLEITRMAERIGTYELSVQPFDDCCSLFLPRHPKTRVKVLEAREAEGVLDVEALVRAAVGARQVVKVNHDALAPTEGGAPVES